MNRAHVMSFPSLILAALALSGTVGCGSTSKPAANAANAAVSTTAPQTRNDVATPTSGSIQIEDRILKACGDIPEAHFAFDSASIQSQAQTSLIAVARCFVSGPLKGQGMKLVGHADPRGTDSYNIGLGQKRAGSVAEFLSEKGLPLGHVATSSVGAAEAKGTDEQGWAEDRKVDVLLAN